MVYMFELSYLGRVSSISPAYIICTELTIEHNEKKELGEATWSEVFDNSNNKQLERRTKSIYLSIN